MDKIATFAERLNELIETKGITKTDLAKTCGIDKSNITRYCSGAYEAKQDVIYKIANAYNVEVSWLMGYPVPMHEDDLYALAKETARRNEFFADPELEAELEDIRKVLVTMSPEARKSLVTLLKGYMPQGSTQDSSEESQ